MRLKLILFSNYNDKCFLNTLMQLPNHYMRLLLKS